MECHQIDPDDFLQRSADIDYTLAETQSSPWAGHPRRFATVAASSLPMVIAAMLVRARASIGILDNFDDIFDIVAAEPHAPKPGAPLADRFLGAFEVDASQESSDV